MQPIFTRAMESITDQDEFARLLTTAGIDPATFSAEKMLEIFEPLAKKGMLNLESFIGRLTNEIADFSAQAAAAKFGVSSRGFIAKMADLMKAGESLAFLRINPAYFVRNLVNGEMTGLGRMGIFYRFVPGGMQKLLKRIGISPTRLRAGFGIAGDVPAHYTKVAGGQQAIKAIDDVIRGIESGDPNAITRAADAIRGIPLPIDTGALSAKVESSQSFALTTRGIFEYMAKHHDVPEMSKALRGLLGDERAATFTRALRGAWADSEIEDVFLKPATARMNSRSVVDDASAAFGEDVTRTIPHMEAHAMSDDLVEAYSKGGAEAVKDTVERLRGEVTQRYSAALKNATSDIQRNIIDHVQHGGIDSAMHHHSGMLDEFWGTVHGKYVDEFGAVFEQIKNADPKVAGALWNTVRTRARTFWDDSWSLFEAQSEGITKGLRAWGKDAGQPFPNLKDYGRTFKTWRGGWEKFWKTRDTLIDEWVEARKAGKAIDYSTIKGQIDEAFDAAVGVEDNAFSQLDELMTQYAPKDFQDLYRAGRQEVSGVRQLMREHVQRFQADPLGDGRAYLDLDANEQIQAYQHFWRERKTYLDQIVQSEKKSRASMFGDLEARASYGAGTPPPPTLADEFLAQYDEFVEANLGRVKGPDTLPPPEPGKARSVLGRFADAEDPDAVIRELGDTDLNEVAQLTADKLGIDVEEFKSALFNELLTPELPSFSGNAMSDAEGIIGRIMPQDQGLFELWNMKGSKALDAIGESVIERGKRPPIKLDDIDEAGEKLIRSYIEQSKANLASSRYQAIKFGEWKRDSGLLNYNRRLNYNTWLGTIMPFEFWTTTSIRKWALFTLDRPTMASLYLRLNDFLLKGYRPESGLPERLRGQIRVNMPMLPDFLGDEVFVDPLALLLPFKQWEYAADSLTRDENRDVGRARRVLQELLNSDEITEEQYAMALQNEAGPQWERAITLARLDDTEGRTSAFDFMSLLTAPHVPIAWAQQILKGTPEDIRPLLPLTRTIKGATALLGVGEAGGVNIEGNIREFLGLPRFDKWDDYRTNRMLANMVADGIITAQQANLAMVSESGEHYEEAKRRAGIEFGVGAVGGTLGIPLKAYPPGEEHLRKLKDDYEAAWDQYNAGDDTALNDFFEENPDYESRRLALEFDPQEQLRRFLIDEIWDRWHDLPIQHKRDLADGLGEVFQTAFLDNDTRSTDNISSDMLQAWLQIMGGETPGKAEWDQDLHPIELTDPATAQRLDAFYLTRRQNFRYNENVAPLWDTYFKLDKDARKKFFRENPILKQYLDWRNDFMFRNPDLAPFIEDDPDKLPVFETLEELQEAEQAQPDFTWFEWQNVLTLPMWRLARDMLRYGDNLGEDEVEELIDVADGLGIEFEELMFRLEGAYEEAEGAPVAGGNGAALQEGAGPQGALEGGDLPLPGVPGAEASGGLRRSLPTTSPRPPNVFTEIINDVVFGLKSLGQTILSFFGPTEAQEELAQHIRVEFPGFKQSVIDQSKKIVEDPKALELVNPGGGIAPWNLDIGPVEIVAPALVADVKNRYTVLHELGHEMDELGPGKDIFSGSKEFKRAVLKTIAMDPKEGENEPWGSTRESLVTFPGVGGNTKAQGAHGEVLTGFTGGWGGYSELYAEVFALAEGYLDNVPPPMRPFYRKFMNFAPDQASLYTPPEKSIASGLAVQDVFEGQQRGQELIAFRERQAEGFRTGLRNRADDLFGPPVVNRAMEEMSRGERVSSATLGMVVDAGGARGLPEDAAVSIFLYLISAGEILPEDPSMLEALEPFG